MKTTNLLRSPLPGIRKKIAREKQNWVSGYSSHRHTCRSWVRADMESIVLWFSVQRKPRVLSVDDGTGPVHQFDVKDVISGGSQFVDDLVAEPKFGIYVAKSVTIVGPVPVKIHWSVPATLNDCPPSTVMIQVTVNLFCRSCNRYGLEFIIFWMLPLFTFSLVFSLSLLHPLFSHSLICVLISKNDIHMYIFIDTKILENL